MKKGGHILVVDDTRLNRQKLTHSLEKQGHTVDIAENGQQALDMIRAQSFDLVLLDIMMPEMDGYQVLEHAKADDALRDIPIIVISAIGEMDSVVRCIEMGAEEYLPKPFNPVLLKARIGACLEKKRLRDQEHAYLEQLQIEKERSERLLLNILPKPIANRLKADQGIIADSFAQVSVIFADIVDFTRLSVNMSPKDLVVMLNGVFSAFDQLVEQHGLEKIKTIGDEYMAVGGLSTPRADHVEAIADMALDMQASIEQFKVGNDRSLRIRIGIHVGPVVAGVIGQKKFSYDLWGDTVNTASRMASHGLSDHTQVTAEVYERLKDKYLFKERGAIRVKSKGEMMTFFLVGKR